MNSYDYGVAADHVFHMAHRFLYEHRLRWLPIDIKQVAIENWQFKWAHDHADELALTNDYVCRHILFKLRWREHIPDNADNIVSFDKAKSDKQAEQDAPEDKAPEPEKKARRGKQPKADKPDKEPPSEKAPRQKKAAADKAAPAKEETPAPEPEKPPEPREAPKSGEVEQIVYLNLSELYAFKDHPFEVRDDDEMRAMVESVKDKGVTQPAIVRPREDGGFEIVSGHRRQKASELAGYFEMPCIVRNLTDEQAITQMVEDNTNQRENILPSERAKALKMQLDAIKRQGARGDLGAEAKAGNGQRSNEIVAERNKMTVKQVQRYIAVAIEGQQLAPSLSQAQRMRELDQKGVLNADVIDGIMLEKKKEVDKVIISSQELSQYFGKEKTPREMKDQILKLLDDWAGQNKDMAKPEKQADMEK